LPRLVRQGKDGLGSISIPQFISFLIKPQIISFTTNTTYSIQLNTTLNLTPLENALFMKVKGLDLSEYQINSNKILFEDIKKVYYSVAYRPSFQKEKSFVCEMVYANVNVTMYMNNRHVYMT
jgi:hypothetical protein